MHKLATTDNTDKFADIRNGLLPKSAGVNSGLRMEKKFKKNVEDVKNGVGAVGRATKNRKNSVEKLMVL